MFQNGKFTKSICCLWQRKLLFRISKPQKKAFDDTQRLVRIFIFRIESLLGTVTDDF